MSDIYEDMSEERKYKQENGELPTWYTTGGYQILCKKYLDEDETAYDRYYSVAKTAAKHTNDPEGWTKRFFEVLWNGWLSPATPVLTNMGKPSKGTPVSCSGQYVGDSVYDFYGSQQETGILSQNGFGTSGYFGDVRPRGSDFASGGKASGVMPVIKGFIQLSRDISQGSNRRGAFASYLPIDHGDFYEAIDYLMHYPDDNNMGWILTEDWAKKMDEGDSDSLKRLQKIMKVRSTLGKGYLMKEWSANAQRPQMYKDLGLDVKASQLCVTGDQLVVSDRGLKTSQALHEEGGDLILFDGQRPVKSSPMKLVEEDAEVCRITLSNGMTHDVTHYHKVKTKRGMVAAEDLTGDDHVYFQTSEGLFGDVHMPDEAFLLGRGYSEGDSIPEIVLESDLQSQVAYLKGLGQSPNDIVLENVTDFVKTLKLLLVNLGIELPIPAGDYYNASSVLSVEPIGKQDVYCVTVDSEDHLWVCNGIVTSNCTEILLHSSEDLTYTCVLSSMNLSMWDDWKDTDAVYVSTVFLDCVAQEFIEVAKTKEGMEKSVAFTEKSRALGLGVLGYHTYLQENMIPFASFDAMMWNAQVFKSIQEESLKASQWMAKEFGEPEWCVGYGVRNTHRTAIAPTMSTSLLMGGVSQGIEPIIMNVFDQTTGGGKVKRINPTLIKLMKDRGVYDKKTLEGISDNAGSVKDEEWLSDEEKKVFLTAFELNQMDIIKAASQRQPRLCQTQSLNTFFAEDEDEEWIMAVVQAFITDPNLITLYYQRSMSGVQAAKGEACEACQ